VSTYRENALLSFVLDEISVKIITSRTARESRI
jgi:hypothetical protein